MQWWHWLIIIAAFVLLFGAKRLPDAARGVGRSLRILKSEVGAMSQDEQPTTTAATTPAPAPVAPAQLAAPAPVVQPQPAPAPTAEQRAS